MTMLTETLLRYREDLVFLFNDLETEGLNLFYTRPWQCTWTKFSIKKGIISERDEFPFWEDINVSQGAAMATGFNVYQYRAKSRPAKEVLEEFLKEITQPNVIIVGHNWLVYDHQILKVWARLCGMEIPKDLEDRVIDTVALSRAYRLNLKPDRENFTAWQYKMMSNKTRGIKTKLKDMADEFKIEYDPSKLHNALYDLRLNASVFKDLIYKVEI